MSRIKLILLILGLVFLYSSQSAKLRPFKKDKVLRAVLHDVISQNKLEGFVIFNTAIGKRRSVFRSKVEDIIGQATKMTTVTSLLRGRGIARYVQNTSRFYNPRDVLLIQGNLAARDNVYLIVIIYNFFSKSTIGKTLALYERFANTQSVTKMLVVFIVSQRYRRYKDMLKSFAKLGLENVEVLEIEIVVNGTSEITNYKVLRYNLQRKLFKAQKYREGLRLLPNLAKNLHGYPIKTKGYIARSHTSLKNYINSKERIPYFLFLYHIQLAVEALNATFQLVPKASKTAPDIRTVSFELKNDAFYALIAPLVPKTAYFMTPSFYDNIQQDTYDMWLASLFVTCWTISCFWFCAKFFNFDRLTWDLTIIFSMIISASNPRNPVLASEFMLFMSLISIGFFFGSELVSNLTTVSIERSVERPIETWDDLKMNNITLMYFYIHENNMWTWENVKKLKHICVKGASDATQRKYFGHMLRYRNVSLESQTAVMCGLDLPQRFKILGKVRARLSNVKEHNLGLFLTLRPNRPWYHHLSNYLARVHESKLTSPPELIFKTQEVYWECFERVINEYTNELINNEEEEDNVGKLENYWLLIVISSALSLVVLIIERKFSQFMI